MTTPVQSTAVAAPLPAHMLNRGSAWAQRNNIMDTIHSIKVYNPAPWKPIEADKGGFIMIKNGETEGRYVPFAKEVGMNILCVRKGLNGAYNLLDEAGNPILDANNEPKRGFAFTEEYRRWSKNTQEVFFKDKNSNGITKQPIGALKEMFRTPVTPNGIKNPYHKVGIDGNGIAFDTSFINESYVIYGVFTDGKYAGEYFRLLISGSGFGNKYDRETKTFVTIKDSLNDALQQAQKAFNNKYQGQGYFDDSFLITKLVPNLEGNNYRPRFYDNVLNEADNSEDYAFIENLRKAYDEQEFSEYNPQGAVSAPVQNAVIEAPQSEVEPVMATPAQATAQAQAMQAQANQATQQVNNQPQGGYYTPNAEQRGQMEEVRNPVTGQPAPAQAQPVMSAQGAHAAMQAESEWDISISDVPF